MLCSRLDVCLFDDLIEECGGVPLPVSLPVDVPPLTPKLRLFAI
jgi:hypothetical protein